MAKKSKYKPKKFQSERPPPYHSIATTPQASQHRWQNPPASGSRCYSYNQNSNETTPLAQTYKIQYQPTRSRHDDQTDAHCSTGCVGMSCFFLGFLLSIAIFLAIFCISPTSDDSDLVYWGELVGEAHCAAYGARKYKARLEGISKNWIRACETTPIQIHNQMLGKPDYCENQGYGQVIGHWLVDFDEPFCEPYWGQFRDLGCLAPGSHTRQFQSRLWGIEAGEGWMTLCSSTPAEILGLHFTRPTHCDNRGWLGMYGVWDVFDSGC